MSNYGRVDAIIKNNKGGSLMDGTLPASDQNMILFSIQKISIKDKNKTIEFSSKMVTMS